MWDGCTGLIRQHSCPPPPPTPCWLLPPFHTTQRTALPTLLPSYPAVSCFRSDKAVELNESAHAVHSLQSDGSMDPAADLAVDAALFLMDLVDRKLHPAVKTPGTGSAEPPAAAADAASGRGTGEGASTAGGPGGGGRQSRPAVITSAAAVLRADEAWGAYVSLLPAHPGSVLDWPPDEVSQGSFGMEQTSVAAQYLRSLLHNTVVSVFIQRILSSPVLELPSPLRARVSHSNPLLPLDHNHLFFLFVHGVMGMGHQTLVAMPAALSHSPHGHTYFPRAVLASPTARLLFYAGPAASDRLPASGQGGDDTQGGRDDVAGAAASGPGGREGVGVIV